ncbi:MAG: succinyldiaminopimelate transaminase [Micrococcaceae bacterium]
MLSYQSFGLNLPDYPWEAMAPYQKIAEQHSDGVVNLSIGTPVDPTPKIIQQALAAHADAPGYPTTHGMVELREAISNWYARRRNVPDLDPENIMPTVGSKELVAWLPTLLGLKAEDIVVHPTEAYPTYAIGAEIAGVQSCAADKAEDFPTGTKLIWVNSPGNPNGKVQDEEELKSIVEWAREHGAVVASDECYAELGWEEWENRTIPCILDPNIAGSSHEALLSVYSLSKQSNLAGYRAAFVAGDPTLMSTMINTRKHAGMIVPTPVQYAMIAAVSDEQHVQQQKDIYRERRELLKNALEKSGFTLKDSTAGLYLWCTNGHDTWDTVELFAKLGIIVGPGTFYTEGESQFVRIAITDNTENVKKATRRIESYFS